MSFSFMPFFTGDYYRDTRHLSMLQHGAYRQLLDHCWDQRGPLPLELDKCFRICGAVSKEEQDAVRSVIAEYFTRMEDGFYNRRMQREIERSQAISSVRSEAGKRGYQAKAKHLLSKSQASAKQVPLTPTTTTTTTTTTTKARAEARATRFALDSAPQDWVDFCMQKRQDLDPAETFARFGDYWTAQPGARGRKLDWFATWRNWVRNEKLGQPRKLTPDEVAAEAIRQIEAREARDAKI